MSIAEVGECAVVAATEWLNNLDFPAPTAPVGEAIRAQISRRLSLLQELGLEYLQLNRRADTLSSGEFQRLRLGSALSSGTTQMLYVLDEPSAGLHARDAAQLLNALRELRDAGNSVFLIEHDSALLRGADWLVDMGPGAGTAGGQVVAEGTPSEVAATESLTGRYLRGALQLPRTQARQPQGWLVLSGARGHNLRQLDVQWPLGTLTCVTGVSGSGKSSLVSHTLHPLLAAKLHGAQRRPLPYNTCTGIEQVARVVAVDQRPIGRTPRSNAATYTGLLAPIRRLFADLPEARLRGYRPGHFSFKRPRGSLRPLQRPGSAQHAPRCLRRPRSSMPLLQRTALPRRGLGRALPPAPHRRSAGTERGRGERTFCKRTPSRAAASNPRGSGLGLFAPRPASDQFFRRRGPAG